MAAVLVLAGGLVGVLASLQPWVIVKTHGIKGVEDLSQSFKGTSGWEGKLGVVLGVVCLIFAFLWFSKKEAGPLKGAIASGVTMVAVAAYTIATLTTQFTSGFVQEATVRGMSEEAARGLITGWIDSGQLSVAAEIWMYVLIGAGVAAVLGGVLALMVKPSAPSGSWPPPSRGL